MKYATVRSPTAAISGPEPGARGTIDRAEHLIDRFRVRYEFGGGWSCVCADFLAHDACKHTREAAGRRAAQAQIARHLQQGSAGSF